MVTPKLGFEVLSASQSQKHVTVNDDFRIADALIQATVKSMALNTPPGSPSDGDTYVVAASPTGAWSGKANAIAYYNATAWEFFTPEAGWFIYDNNTTSYYSWNGTNWVGLEFGQLGINTSSSSTNRLAVASQAILFTHDSSGGNVIDCRINLNKANSGATASTLYQDAFTGYAEVGLCGDDNFHFKISPDGSTWHEALILDPTNGLKIGYSGGKLAFYGATQVSQQNGTGNTHTVTAGSTTNVFTNTTFDGSTGSTAYTVGDIVKALKNYGLLAA